MIKHIFKLIWNKRRSNALILFEIFLAFLVLFAVLSYVTYNFRMFTEPMGFESKNKWLVNLETFRQKDSLEIINLRSTLKSELLQMDNVEDLSFTSSAYPYSGSTNRTSQDGMGFSIASLVAGADSDYKDALGLTMREGRWFNEEDLAAAYPPMIVNKAFMEKYFPNKSMLDSMIILFGEHKIVGVVEAYRYKGQFSENEPIVFRQEKVDSKLSNHIILNMTPGTNVVYEEKINKLIRSITKADNFIISDLDKSRKRNAADTWIPMIMLMSMCGFLCINVALGLFGVLWYNINKRRGEIGLRRAIGAHSSDIKKQFVLEIIILASIGILLGVFFAIQVPLLKLGPLAPINMYYAIAMSALIILVLVILCALQPSWQASRIHPSTALHEE
ncbi:MAG: putative ABC transport system permease protein [Saprospiraceae bacterium]|jgi:putative ABC transport system permease protein